MLHRLPNGTWIELTKVDLVAPLEGMKPPFTVGTHPPRVSVVSGDDYHSLPFDTFAAAQAYADELAALVNEAKSDA